MDLLITNQMIYHWAIRAIFFYCYIVKETLTMSTHCLQKKIDYKINQIVVTLPWFKTISSKVKILRALNSWLWIKWSTTEPLEPFSFIATLPKKLWLFQHIVTGEFFYCYHNNKLMNLLISLLVIAWNYVFNPHLEIIEGDKMQVMVLKSHSFNKIEKCN